VPQPVFAPPQVHSKLVALFLYPRNPGWPSRRSA